jgi:hypothetical protein
VEKVVLAIAMQDGRVAERFVFDIAGMEDTATAQQAANPQEVTGQVPDDLT